MGSGGRESKVIGTKMGKLFRSLSVFSLVTVLSRITGLIRELSLAYFFGASVQLDLFWVAYRIPNFLRKLFAEGALSQAMIPVLSEYQAKQHDQKDIASLKEFLNQLGSWILMVLTLIVVIAHYSAPYIVWLFAPGIARNPAKLTLSIQLLHIMFPALIFISLAAYSGSILNSYQRFGIPAFAQNWFNIIIVAVVWFLAPHSPSPIHLLAWGALLSSLIQWLFQLPSLMEIKMLPKFTIPHLNAGVHKVIVLMLPALFGISVTQINLLVDTFLVSFLPPGSVSWLNYADRLTSLPLGVVGVALATVILPQLSQKHFKHDIDNFISTFRWAIQCMILVALPCVIVLQLLAEPIVATLFQRGAFTVYDTEMTARALRCLALGIPAFMSVKILAACFYAQQNLKTPVKIAVIAVILNGILAFILSNYWQHAGISLATTLSSYLNAGLLWYKLTNTINFSLNSATTTDQDGFWPFIRKVTIALSGFATIILLANHCAGNWQTMSELKRLITLLIILVSAFSGYLAILTTVRVPLKQLLKA